MSGILRLANTGAGNGRSTLQSAASNDVTFNLPDTGADSTATILTSELHSITSVNWDGMTINITNADFNVDSGTLFVDESTSRVGIGTTTPSAKLEVNVAGALGTSTNEVAKFTSTVGNTRGISISAPGNTSAYGKFAMVDTAARMSFWTGNPASEERLSILSDGNVGIGTNSPDQILHLRKPSANAYARFTNDTVNGYVGVSNGQSTFDVYVSTNHDMRFLTNNGEKMRIEAGGDVGINVTNPTRKLEVRDGVNNNTATEIIRWARPDGNVAGTLGVGLTTGNGVFINTATGHPLSFQIDESEAMRVVPGGNLGIGTAGAVGRLTVRVGDSNGNPNNWDSNYVLITSGDATTSQALGFGVNTANDYNFIASLQPSIAWKSLKYKAIDHIFEGQNESERARIDTSGRLLVGTTAIIDTGGGTGSFQVAGDSASTAKASIVRTNGESVFLLARGENGTDATGNVGSIIFKGYNTNGYKTLSSITTAVDGTGSSGGVPGRLVFSTTDDGASTPTERMRIRSNGNIGIGTDGIDTCAFYLKPHINYAGTAAKYSIINQPLIDSGTTNMRMYWSRSQWGSSGDFTVNELTHFQANTDTPPSNVTLINQYAFVASSNFTGANNNYGFYSDIAASNGRWNFYANGDATNFFNGSVLFNSNNESSIEAGTTNGKSVGSSGIMYSARTGTDERSHIFFTNTNGTVGSITTLGSATTYATASDYRLKENVTPMTGAVDRVKALKPCRFNFKADADKTIDGFLAHEAQEVVPEAVTGEKDGKEMQAIDTSKLVPLLTAALQEALAEIAELKERVKNLEG